MRSDAKGCWSSLRGKLAWQQSCMSIFRPTIHPTIQLDFHANFWWPRSTFSTLALHETYTLLRLTVCCWKGVIRGNEGKLEETIWGHVTDCCHLLMLCYACLASCRAVAPSHISQTEILMWDSACARDDMMMMHTIPWWVCSRFFTYCTLASIIPVIPMMEANVVQLEC